MKHNRIFDELAHRVEETRDSLLKKYSLFLLRFYPFRRLVAYLHRLLNRMQYDPLNPQNRSTDNPQGYQTDDEKALAALVEKDKNLLDKVETYFRLRPVSTAILAFFVISAAATSSRGQPLKIAIALVIIFAILPLLLSTQDEVAEEIDAQENPPVS
jgi:hypothetical protein